MNKIRLSHGIVVAVFFLLSTNYCAAFQAGNDTMLKTYGLRHTDAAQVSRVAQTMMSDSDVRMEIDQSTNRIVLLGSKDAHNQMANLIEQLDVQTTREPLPQSIKVFELAHSDAHEIARVLAELFPNEGRPSDFRLSVDSSGNDIVVSGNKETLAIIESLLARLDTPPRQNQGQAKSAPKNCTVRISWLVDSDEMDEGMRKHLSTPRPGLEKLIRKLQEDDLMGQVEKLTEVQTLVSPATSSKTTRQFSNSGHGALGSQPVKMSIEGVLFQESKDTVMLDLSVICDISNVISKIETSVTMPIGHPVAFSVSDVNYVKSIIVVEVVGAN